ncbi:MAG: dacB [Ferruginibacter sp.]|nr:dacB [Ferruginibacter sp.]
MFQSTIVAGFSLFLFHFTCSSQNISVQLDNAIQKMYEDGQFKHAVISLYVIDSKTAKLVYDKNSQLGLAAASCQKVITGISAFELLGKDFQFRTYIDHDQKINNGSLEGNLYVTGGGDPTTGSDRWTSTSETSVLKKILNILQKNNIHSVKGDLVCNDANFTSDPLPRGWIWEDIGNYYGAGAWGFNWRENQFDVTFKTGKLQGDITEIISTKPSSLLQDYTFANFVTTGAKGSGDNGYLFSSPFQKNIIARGTVPMTESGFTISGAMPDPPTTFVKRLKEYLKESRVAVSGNAWSQSEHIINNQSTKMHTIRLDSILSPTLDSINYWFLKKSVNLYGEALVKMLAYKEDHPTSTDAGITTIKQFWSKQGIEKSALGIIDGSGLSPGNRITTEALVTVMQYAKGRNWFTSFYNALPETNKIKMKDGYINGVRSYTGYVKSRSGAEYTFAFIVNNFDGSAGTVREKMWKILDLLKN